MLCSALLHYSLNRIWIYYSRLCVYIVYIQYTCIICIHAHTHIIYIYMKDTRLPITYTIYHRVYVIKMWHSISVQSIRVQVALWWTINKTVWVHVVCLSVHFHHSNMRLLMTSYFCNIGFLLCHLLSHDSLSTGFCVKKAEVWAVSVPVQTGQSMHVSLLAN